MTITSKGTIFMVDAGSYAVSYPKSAISVVLSESLMIRYMGQVVIQIKNHESVTTPISSSLQDLSDKINNLLK